MTSPTDADLAEKIKLAAEAFLYGYPLVYNMREIAKFSAGPNLVQPGPLPYNTFGYARKLLDPKAHFVSPKQRHPVPDGHVRRAQRPPGAARARHRRKENGYITDGFGKWHMTPGREMGPAGPFEHWPLSWGFDHWWGFLTGAAGQYDPVTTQDNAVLGVPEGKDGKLYYFPDDITDKAVEWLHAVRAHDAQKPWFMYYSTGATHAPHHVAREWADKYKGQFDDGWDKYRERTLERQKKLGIVPPDTELAPRPDPYPAWDTLSDAEKKLYRRQMEVFAGFSENTDWNVGRLLDAVEEMGELEDTLVIYIWGDNVTLWANDKQIGEGRLDHTCAMLFTSYAAMDMGRDNGGVVDLAYEEKAPYAFTGKLKKVVFDLKPAHAEAEQSLHEQTMVHAVAAGAAG